jgi:hypothetical protein
VLHKLPLCAMQLVQLFTQYFSKVKEKFIRENFVLIYELLDEVCDNGVPQITEPSVLKEYIFQKGTHLADKKEAAADVTVQVTGAVAHRNPRVTYKRNEVYLDIVETTHVLMSVDGAFTFLCRCFEAQTSSKEQIQCLVSCLPL